MYDLEFLPSARKEWDKLDSTVKRQFAKKLGERLAHPRVPSASLHSLPDCYKIKLRKVGYRLVYPVHDDRVVVQVVAVGRRDRDEAYEAAAKRV